MVTTLVCETVCQIAHKNAEMLFNAEKKNKGPMHVLRSGTSTSGGTVNQAGIDSWEPPRLVVRNYTTNRRRQ